MSQEKTAAQKHLARVMDYKKVFSGESGKRVLFDLMHRHFMLISSVTVGADVNDVVFREGQRRVVLDILEKLKTKPEDLEEKITEGLENVY